MTKKEEKIARAVDKAKKQGFKVSRPISDKKWFTMTMWQDLITKGKDVRKVTFKDYSHGLLIDGVLYHMEIMLYTKRDTNKTIKETGMEIVQLGQGTVSLQ